jgi:hypothetical protein
MPYNVIVDAAIKFPVETPQVIDVIGELDLYILA